MAAAHRCENLGAAREGSDDNHHQRVKAAVPADVDAIVKDANRQRAIAFGLALKFLYNRGSDLVFHLLGPELGCLRSK